MGQILPLIIGVISIPVIINGMGSERFGVKSRENLYLLSHKAIDL